MCSVEDKRWRASEAVFAAIKAMKALQRPCPIQNFLPFFAGPLQSPASMQVAVEVKALTPFALSTSAFGRDCNK